MKPPGEFVAVHACRQCLAMARWALQTRQQWNFDLKVLYLQEQICSSWQLAEPQCWCWCNSNSLGLSSISFNNEQKHTAIQSVFVARMSFSLFFFFFFLCLLSFVSALPLESGAASCKPGSATLGTSSGGDPCEPGPILSGLVLV